MYLSFPIEKAIATRRIRRWAIKILWENLFEHGMEWERSEASSKAKCVLSGPRKFIYGRKYCLTNGLTWINRLFSLCIILPFPFSSLLGDSVCEPEQGRRRGVFKVCGSHYSVMYALECSILMIVGKAIDIWVEYRPCDDELVPISSHFILPSTRRTRAAMLYAFVIQLNSDG